MRFVIVIAVLFCSTGCQQETSPNASTATLPPAQPGNGLEKTQSQQLIEAAFRGDSETVKFLINNDVDVNARYNGSPSVFRGDDGGTPIAAGNWTALHAAASALRPSIIKLLIDADADLDLDDGYGATALAMSLDVYDRDQQRDECALLLIAAGASVNTRTEIYIDGVGGQTPLHDAVAWNQKRAVVALIDAGADVNAKDDGGSTPLHVAYLCDADPLIVKALLDAGADPDSKDNEGRIPSYWK